ncbi:MAG: hypothetical protein OEM60_08055 [Gammaproteobacteria bacterium]|nr:hypothetical protein [Gammaproteobacteria bacterium]MDH3433796.1 hypothetical protein [Gammaproteobacteria bacterium]
MQTNDAPTTTEARGIMLAFAEQTGVSSSRNPPRRYLWTDAHAVCNFLSLYRRTRDETYLRLALSLIDQVHAVLGKHRADDPRSGWISGLRDEEGGNHPTVAGLRIGKHLNERGRHDAFDERLEWDRDGQYFHYLTKWMHALCRASAVTNPSKFSRWALELAKVAQAKFAFAVPGDTRKRLRWKMSIDLAYPLVPSSGLHDPLDAYITYHEIAACLQRSGRRDALPALGGEIAETAAMIEGQRWHTDDPLGLGGLLFDTYRAMQLCAAGHLQNVDFVTELGQASAVSLDAFVQSARLQDPAQYRLAFRELGLSIGLKAAPGMASLVAQYPGHFAESLGRDIEAMTKFSSVGETIERFWLQGEHQKTQSWQDHLDINRVMLATSLLPEEFLNVMDYSTS